MEYLPKQLAQAVKFTQCIIHKEDAVFSHLLTDSRKLIFPEQTLFIALKGNKLDGHHYVKELYQKGVRNFLVENITLPEAFPDANFYLAKNSLQALQDFVAFHRSHFHIPVIAITGSNGKTIVKEWLYQLLHHSYNIVRSPKSYNSQIGVPLSVWQMEAYHNLGVFEAGISQPGEMEKLEPVIQPNIGIFTNIGEAHNEGFLNALHKTREKLKLFIHTDVIIYSGDDPNIKPAIAQANFQLGTDEKGEERFKSFCWSRNPDADVFVQDVAGSENKSKIKLRYKEKTYDFVVPFTDKASIENALHCISCLFYLKVDAKEIQKGISELNPVSMRLELRTGINNCRIINDSYNSDINSLSIAVDFLKQQGNKQKKTVILSDLLQTGKNEPELYEDVIKLLQEAKINRLIGIGSAVSRQKTKFEKHEEWEVILYHSTQDFLNEFDTDNFDNEDVLIKGARSFRFERIAQLLEKKAHDTILEVNLNALQNNLKEYQRCLPKQCKTMVMVKAFAYGAGSFEVANLLAFNKIDYLGVAFADEGVELRRAGIEVPIMVMNADSSNFDNIITNKLEPEIFSLKQLSGFIKTLRILADENDAEPFSIHLKLDTGMHRLGFVEEDLDELCDILLGTELIKVKSVFSHLAASDDLSMKEFTLSQITLFEKMSGLIQNRLHYPFLRHILNSAGIVNYPQAAFDMVRLGLGIYGVDATRNLQIKPMTVATLKCSISQIKNIQQGESIGYSRAATAEKDMRIATMSIGYADGYDRRFSKGKGYMMLHGKKAPVVGNVCMDMCMIDISQIAEAQEGDEAEVFGNQINIDELAASIGTISYELLAGISGRVKRIYFQE